MQSGVHLILAILKMPFASPFYFENNINRFLFTQYLFEGEFE
jgi:hypothetical protein